MDLIYLSKEGLSYLISSLLSKFSKKGHLHTKAQIEDFPTKLSEFDNDLNFDNITFPEATATSSGFMSSADKVKLDGMEVATFSETAAYLGLSDQ